RTAGGLSDSRRVLRAAWRRRRRPGDRGSRGALRLHVAVGLLAGQPLRRGRLVEERPLLGEALLLPRVLVPGVRRDQRGGRRSGREQIEAKAYDVALHEGIERRAARIAEREVAEDEARHAAVLDDVARAAEHDRRNAVGLEVPGDQT